MKNTPEKQSLKEYDNYFQPRVIYNTDIGLSLSFSISSAWQDMGRPELDRDFHRAIA